ncbi:polysaccharide pyruvyl transferase [Krasilnikovia cinnamomea]|uniref:Polysaccharide pyruvyl transferase n=1 Tax=Krasilnikovia cinnamomea TaxID=349313 RepID=A0A4Q7ZQM7_9ACTN|nr:polysaccharide pyruvyl transferase family protein [Krasilnikovia cinnamomea]RZU53420.1 polysaccharide pyruvyl transferase [Krasilnikovia cinnamomea]
MANRRNFLEAVLAAGLIAQAPGSAQAAADPGCRADAPGNRAPRILLRSSWQTVNIGDVAHTPGVLALLEKHLPHAEVQLWPSDVGHGVRQMLLARFPKLKVINQSSETEVRQALAYNDFLLHGSGPMLLGAREVARWRTETGKPYGVLGITYGGPDELDLLNAARFAYFRDYPSLQRAQADGLKTPVTGFGPDGAFATDLRDDVAASAFCDGAGLRTGQFLCVIPRYRTTPYWEIYNRPMTDADRRNDALNQSMKEHDHAPLRAAMIQVVRQTSLRVLVCPEDASQVRLGKEVLVDPLPADVRARVVWRDSFWTSLAEAVGVYARSAGMLSNEQHSPILSIGHGVPALLCRWKQQTSKGFMWRSIGLADWLFDMDDEASIGRIVPAVLAVTKDLAAAQARARAARALVRERHAEEMAVLGTRLRATG